MEPFLILYFIGYLCSVVVVSGWDHAYFEGKYPSKNAVELRINGMQRIGITMIFSVIWPIIVPLQFFYSGGAVYGWKNPLDWEMPE